MSAEHSWSRVELALGMPLGVVPEALTLMAGERPPRDELELVIDQEYASGRQVFVCFSGGRDSSAVLALATHVARRRGATLPVPVTLRFAEHPESDESQWQEMVVRHLDLPEWIVIDRPDADLLDPGITERLDAWGLFYPSQIGSYLPIVEAAAGGVLLTGEGGDESFGGWQFPRRCTRGAGVRGARPRRRPSRPCGEAPPWGGTGIGGAAVPTRG